MRREASSANGSQFPRERSSLSSNFFLRLLEREVRDREGLYFVEGFRFAHAAVDAGADIAAVGWCPELALRFPHGHLQGALSRYPQCLLKKSELHLLEFSPEPQGIVLALRQRKGQLSDVERRRNKPWIGIESVRSLGNLGTVFRSAVAADGGGILQFRGSKGYEDVFSPSVLRSSMGAHLALPIVRTTYHEFSRWSYRSEFRVLGADAEGTLNYRKVSYRRPVVLMIGEERAGLSPGQRSICDNLIRIPMAKGVDSLNLAMAATLLMFEAFGQRKA